ncbi:MAG TPA: acetyl-CoA carboxylase biotin carboxyl carrier protein subunit [Fibrobacteria bacterium]|nr:acetyl-CoA carboxylase biotin carboxyl carrier protein subunit [Fibrobacteria bacterium]HOX52287.1 acetyl-CoA carboxylase biotin carboxyl carrier protein subunit [Fibrobacteria bacterium]
MKKLRITVEGKTYEVVVETIDDTSTGASRVAPRAAAPAAAVAAAPAAVAAPAAKPAGAGSAASVRSQLAGRIVSVDVKEGDSVQAGAQVLVLEAMKMNTPVTAPKTGKVTKIYVAAGATVEEGQALLDVE